MIKEIFSRFDSKCEFLSYEEICSGRINNTYLIKANASDSKHLYILQKINQNVFKNPLDVMHNIYHVTEHIKKEASRLNEDPLKVTLSFLDDKKSKKNYVIFKGQYYRCYRYIEDATNIDFADCTENLYLAGIAVGKFQLYLQNFDTKKLKTTIENFHNTPVRFEAFKKSINSNVEKRKEMAGDVIEDYLKREFYKDKITSLLDQNKIPLRVTHNDTKINNVLINKKDKELSCLIDLDTLMPGSVLYDFGDAIRCGASTASESEEDLSKVLFDLDMFEAFTRGFLEKSKKVLNKQEKENLALSCIILTYECGMRFLTDYLDGDVYFKTTNPKQNLAISKNQMKLVKEMEKNLDKMIKIVEKYS